MHLNESNLERLPATITRPSYQRSSVKTGIVHLGLGAFCRAHLADYTESLLPADPRWGISGISLRQTATRDALLPQDGLYTLAVRDGTGETLRIIGALTGLFVAPDSPATLLNTLCEPTVRIVSLTVTEKGYCHDPATGALRADHLDISHDLAYPERPRSIYGFIVEALNRRLATGLAPFTVLSCDNLPSNGATLRRLLIEFAGLHAGALAARLDEVLVCPNVMVDRIVPATTDADRERIAGILGLEDAWPVVTEPFKQWVVEDHFAAGRPAWEETGAEMVNDVLPFEHMKLRLLNGSHSALAYLGLQLGLETVADAVADKQLNAYLRALMEQEVTPTLDLPSGYDLAAYREALLRRFANPALRHRLLQIAMDGSQKLPQRLLAPIRDRLKSGAAIDHLALAVAAWMRHLLGYNEQGERYPINDPLAERLTELATAAGAEAANLAPALLSVTAVFGTDLPSQPRFRGAVTEALDSLLRRGVRQSLAAIS